MEDLGSNLVPVAGYNNLGFRSTL